MTLASMDELTRQAVAALDRQDFGEAQQLFRQNAKRNRCSATLNNLGYYYLEFGMILPDGRQQSSYTLGMQLLLKASRCGTDYKNRMALGWFAMRDRDYPAAERYYAEALSALDHRVARYDLGAALYWQKRYAEALPIFETILGELMPGDEDDDFKNHLRAGIIFCRFYLGDQEKAFRMMTTPDAQGARDEFGMFTFALAYLCGQMEYAKSLYLHLEKKWSHGVPELAMMVDCFEKLGLEEDARERVAAYFEDNEWMTKVQIRAYKRDIADPGRRMALIEDFHFGIPAWQPACYFVGCCEHPDGG